MKLYLFPARNGESILIENIYKHFILVDGGYCDTYSSYIKPYLQLMSDKGFDLDLVISTHIDADHISGIVNLVNDESLTIPIDNIWHNAYKHIQSPVKVIGKESVLIHHNICKQVLEGETNKVSAKQGSTLAALIQKRGINWNIQFDGNVITRKFGVNIRDFVISVLSPTFSNIGNLSKFWRKELIKKGLLAKEHSNEYWDDAFEFCLSKDIPGFRFHAHKVSGSVDFDKIKEHPYEADTSPTNGSSISFVLKTEGKSVLMLGDAHAEDVISGLKELYGDSDEPYAFDAIKLSHHGSYNNNSPELISMIDSENWIILTDGTVYNHPDIEVLAHLITKGDNKKRRLIFNYKLPICKILNNAELHMKDNFEIVTPDTVNKPTTIII